MECCRTDSATSQLPPQHRTPPQFGSVQQQFLPNGSVSGMPQPLGAAGLPPNTKIIEKTGARVLCVADVRGWLIFGPPPCCAMFGPITDPDFFCRPSPNFERASQEGECRLYHSYRRFRILRRQLSREDCRQVCFLPIRARQPHPALVEKKKKTPHGNRIAS